MTKRGRERQSGAGNDKAGPGTTKRGRERQSGAGNDKAGPGIFLSVIPGLDPGIQSGVSAFEGLFVKVLNLGQVGLQLLDAVGTAGVGGQKRRAAVAAGGLHFLP